MARCDVCDAWGRRHTEGETYSCAHCARKFGVSKLRA
jgi:hypothetical protein